MYADQLDDVWGQQIMNLNQKELTMFVQQTHALTGAIGLIF
jgi:hypothetical protein